MTSIDEIHVAERLQFWLDFELAQIENQPIRQERSMAFGAILLLQMLALDLLGERSNAYIHIRNELERVSRDNKEKA